MQIEKYNSVEAISISAFAREIENLVPENMQVVNYKSMVNWLLQAGMLQDSELDNNGRIYKVPTEKGNRIGIYYEKRESERGGQYLLTLYNREAQKYLLEHIEEISRIK